MIYNFRKGNHYPQELHPLGTNHKGWTDHRMKFKLSPEAWYDPKILGNHTNKLGGFTIDKAITINSCGVWNHRNSIRVGWKPSGSHKGYFDISLYPHIDGCYDKYPKYYLGVIAAIGADEWFDVTPSVEQMFPELYYFALTENTPLATRRQIISRTFKGNIGAGYILRPYHGGKPAAHQDYTVEIQY